MVKVGIHKYPDPYLPLFNKLSIWIRFYAFPSIKITSLFAIIVLNASKVGNNNELVKYNAFFPESLHVNNIIDAVLVTSTHRKRN